MGFSILDAHPNNECLDVDSNEAWFSFIFCGSHIDTLRLHAYDYYSGNEIVAGDTVYESVPAMAPQLKMWNGVGNGVRVNVRDFVDGASVFSADGEYTWRAELVQKVDAAKGLYPDNMVYEGVLPGDPNFYATVDNIPGFPYDNYLPLTPAYTDKIKPPYYVDFLDSKFNGTMYDIPVTFDKTQVRSDGVKDTAIQLTPYTSISNNPKEVTKPSVGSKVLIHKRENFGAFVMYTTKNENELYIDPNIPSINRNETDNNVYEGCYLKVGDDYFKITSYDRKSGLAECQNGAKLRTYPAGTHYAIYTSRFWTPYYYFRVHTMPRLIVDAEFHEHRRIRNDGYDDSVNCLENTFNGILFKAYLTGDPHAAVKYHYWEIFDNAGKLVYKTERVYSQEMDCEVFVPFGATYTGKITAVTQDNITVRGETTYTLPASSVMNNERFSLAAKQNAFGGVGLTWKYNKPYGNGTLERACEYEVFRVDKKLNKVKYLGKVSDCPQGITGAVPAFSGGNWYLIDKSCDFTLKTTAGANVNMYLVGGGSDGGDWTASPNPQNGSFALGNAGGAGGYVLKKQVISDGALQCSIKVAERNDAAGTSVTIGGSIYRCNDEGSVQCGAVRNSPLTQNSDGSVSYGNAENGRNGVNTPYGCVGSSGGGGAACGNNRSGGGSGAIGVSGISPKQSGGNWVLIDRDSLGGGSGDFTLELPENAKIKMYLVGGGANGAQWVPAPNPGWDLSASVCSPGGEGGYVFEQEVSLGGSVQCSAIIANVGDTGGTTLTIGGVTYRCNDVGSTKTRATESAAAAKNPNGSTLYKDGENGKDGILTPYGYVGSSGGGGGADNIYRVMKPGRGGSGAGDGGAASGSTVSDGTNATNYGCGGGGGATNELDFNGNVVRSFAGSGMPGCIIFEITEVAIGCPDPGIGGSGAGDGGFPGENGDNAVNYGCGGGGAGYNAIDTNGNVVYGKVGKGMPGCVILEIEGGMSGDRSEISVVDWTAASDKEYRYIVTGCNHERQYMTSRHAPSEMIECTAAVDITPHFEDFFLYFLNEADVLVKTSYNLENYDVPLTEPMGRYVTSRNNPYKTVKRHMHTLAFEREAEAYYRRHTWRIEGDVSLGDVTHNITRNVNQLYSKMPAVTVEPSDYDSFPVSFLFGYLDCEKEDDEGFDFNNQYMFELWKKCVAEKRTIMIKDPKGNVWTGVITGHEYKVEYDTNGMPYIITFDFTQTRTEYNTLVMITDDHNKYLNTAKKNHLK